MCCPYLVKSDVASSRWKPRRDMRSGRSPPYGLALSAGGGEGFSPALLARRAARTEKSLSSHGTGPGLRGRQSSMVRERTIGDPVVDSSESGPSRHSWETRGLQRSGAIRITSAKLAGGPGLLGAAPLALRAARALRVRWLRCATHSNLSGSNPGGSSTQQKNGTPLGPRFFVGWGTRIRTWVDGVRVRSPTARRSPKKRFSAWRTGSRGGPCGDRPSCARPCAHHGSRTRPCAGCPAVRRRIPSTPG